MFSFCGVIILLLGITEFRFYFTYTIVEIELTSIRSAIAAQVTRAINFRLDGNLLPSANDVQL